MNDEYRIEAHIYVQGPALTKEQLDSAYHALAERLNEFGLEIALGSLVQEGKSGDRETE